MAWIRTITDGVVSAPDGARGNLVGALHLGGNGLNLLYRDDIDVKNGKVVIDYNIITTNLTPKWSLGIRVDTASPDFDGYYIGFITTTNTRFKIVKAKLGVVSSTLATDPVETGNSGNIRCIEVTFRAGTIGAVLKEVDGTIVSSISGIDAEFDRGSVAFGRGSFETGDGEGVFLHGFDVFEERFI